MDRVRVLNIQGKEIIYIDYTGCKTEATIEIFEKAKEAVLLQQKDCLLLSNFERTYITPAFMRLAEREMLPLKHLIKKNVFINLSAPQRMILKGFSLFIGSKDYVAFDSYDEAIDFLLCE
ncbi:MAG: hypothetical protein JST43_03485 [Bacteroidetes bacterium]|nr:hypothetical protein [Bacteroidota bacterium]MBS1540211.1 hypothetical protein [Bacteroidota bacterium]